MMTRTEPAPLLIQLGRQFSVSAFLSVPFFGAAVANVVRGATETSTRLIRIKEAVIRRNMMSESFRLSLCLSVEAASFECEGETGTVSKFLSI